jgi:hypothetical protein
MASKKPKRLITKKTSSGKGSRPLSKKTRMQQAGTFELKARRAEIVPTEGFARAGAVRCPDCGAIYFDKHWHSPAVFAGAALLDLLEPRRCGECSLEKGGRSGGRAPYAGEVVLEGPFADGEREEVLSLVRNVGARATKRDPQDRIVRIDADGAALRVYVTENQLAVSIGKQVDRARKGGSLEIVWSKDDKPVRVIWKKG